MEKSMYEKTTYPLCYLCKEGIKDISWLTLHVFDIKNQERIHCCHVHCYMNQIIDAYRKFCDPEKGIENIDD